MNKIILLAAVVLVVLAIQLESLSKQQVREQFRCALRRRRGEAGGGGGNSTATIAAVAGSTAVPGTTTTATVTSTGPPPPIRVSQSCNKGNIGTNAEAENLWRLIRNIY